MGLDFYKKAIDYIHTNPNFKRLRISYSLQTNGVLLDDAWAKWLAQNRVLVGISLDGPQKIHDRYRVDRNGDGTFQRVMRAIRLLEKYRITYNILSVITGTSARHSQQIYEFFRKCGFRYQQYIECLDPIGELPGQHTYSLTPEKYGTFLKGLFDIWYLDMKAGRYVYNRYFENLLMIMNRQPPETCNLCGSCYPQWVIEADGSVYPCDFYALDQWKLGNISINSFEEMKKARKRQEFTIWSESIPKECQMCSWFALCRNGCRRNRETGHGYIRSKELLLLSIHEFFRVFISTPFRNLLDSPAKSGAFLRK